jgi:hypothetical protein
MSPRLKLILAAALGLAIAVYGAYAIADESYGFAGIVVLLVLWIFVEWRGKALPEAWILAVTLFGYIVGNRGFAQLQLSSTLPLLPAELALLACTLGLGVRVAFSRRSPIPFDALNLSLLLWALYATARLPADVKTYGAMALRDYALVYYVAFFFLSQQVARYPASVRLLERAFTASFLVLPLVVVVDKLWPGLFRQYLSWNGIPLIYHKSDLISASLGSGCLWFWARHERTRRWSWLILSAVSLLAIGLEESPRAAIVAVAAATAAWLLARRTRLVALQAGAIAIGIAVSLPAEMISGRSLAETKTYEMYERFVSIVDVNASHAYRNVDSASTIDNNQFRRVWWNSVYSQTVATNPVFGLGFGYDLAARFLADYNWLSAEEEFTTRSPHSIIVTVFGRLGAVGLALFLLCAAMAVRSGYRAFRGADFECMAWWSVVIVVGVSACFGVVLEGPMGAEMFWVALGVAHVRTGEKAALGTP